MSNQNYPEKDNHNPMFNQNSLSDLPAGHWKVQPQPSVIPLPEKGHGTLSCILYPCVTEKRHGETSPCLLNHRGQEGVPWMNHISVGVTHASSGGGQLVRLSGGYQSPTESRLRQDARDAQWKAPVAPRIPASSLPAADLNLLLYETADQPLTAPAIKLS